MLGEPSANFPTLPSMQPSASKKSLSKPEQSTTSTPYCKTQIKYSKTTHQSLTQTPYRQKRITTH